MTPDTLVSWVIDARARTLDFVRDLSDEQLCVPLLRIINPFLWEIGHVAYFQEYWVLRHVLGRQPMRADSDSLYDSAKIAHDIRWELPLPSRAETIDYLEASRDQVVGFINDSSPSPDQEYFVWLSLFHEDMHNEAFTITRQTLGYPAPLFAGKSTETHGGATDPVAGSVSVPGGTYVIGSQANDGFTFDNEKWAHHVDVSPYRIARAATTQQEFARFVDDSGYSRPELWSVDGWGWREREKAQHPVYWRQDPERGWMRRHFDRWVPLEPQLPAANICWYEADAYCRWAGKRLPTESEWEIAATGAQGGSAANLDWKVGGTCDVSSHPEGDSIYGCRQMIGNVWEWTSSDFLPYPGFSEDPYKEYSSPWFGSHKALRGGAWSTRSRLIRTAYRNFYTPDRRDIWAGFRTCEVGP
jgi:iron(II)-dependent oxidoreductase